MQTSTILIRGVDTSFDSAFRRHLTKNITLSCILLPNQNLLLSQSECHPCAKLLEPSMTFERKSYTIRQIKMLLWEVLGGGGVAL